MVPLPQDHPDDFPTGPPTTESVVDATGRDAVSVPLPDDNDGNFPPVAELQQVPPESDISRCELAAASLLSDDSPNPPNADAPPTPPADPSPEKNTAAASADAADPPIETSSSALEGKDPGPGPVSELDLAIATPLPDDTPSFTFERGISVKSIDELKTVFTDTYTRESKRFI
jgi:hypothetical protein